MKANNLLLLSLSLFFGCGNKSSKADTEANVSEAAVIPYNLNKPSQKYILPKSLDEISGLSFYKDHQLACVNDEEGRVFMYDYQKEAVVDKIKFGKAGDYEGVEVVDNEVFVLKSNGMVHGFKIGEAFERDIDCTHPDVKEYEGLSYDPKKKYLLLAAKERVKSKDDIKMIYAYSLTSKTFFKYIGIPEAKVKGDNGNKDFKPSGIAIHPLNRDIYILASQGKKLLVLADDGHKKALISLDPSLYRQPEGICFSPQGELFIASEGAGQAGYILRFATKGD